ncbi:MAG: nuclear transport factor 2 family protein [Actinomycetota bacterium]
MADHPNVQLVRQGFDAFAKGDTDWMRKHLSDDVVWHAPGNNILSGDHRGKDQVLAFFARIFEVTGGTFTQDIHDVVGNDDHVVALVTGRAQRPDGRTYEGRSVITFHIKEDQATESWAFNEDQAAQDAFLS